MSNNTKLEILDCGYNELASLDLSNNTMLEKLECHRNKLTSLDVSNCTVLSELFCRNNQLTSSALDALFETLNSCSENKYIDISNNPGTKDCNKSIAENKGWLVIL